MAELAVGANLPWIDYGQDFGASAWRPQGGVAQPDMGQRMRDALRRLADAGAEAVRWWLLADGRAGLRLDAEGRLAGLDDCVFPDIDAALDALRETGLKAVFVLTDFLWFAPVQVVNGVQVGGRRGLVRSRTRRTALVESVFVPIARRYASEPLIAGWDLLNEPEWATLGHGARDPRCAVSWRTMRAYFAELVAAFRSEQVVQPLSVGLASVRALSLVQGLGFDAYQVHWYEHNDPLAALAQPVASRGLDRPLLLGEFPTRGASVTPARILELAEAAGYSSALAWSLLATDDATDGSACAAALATWSGRARPEP
jgi:hypothetical protein